MILQEFALELVFTILIAIIFFVSGLVVEETFDLLGRKKKEERLKNGIRMAVDCVYEAEEVVPGKKRGAERSEYAVELYRERMGVKKYEEALAAVERAFNLTRLSE